MASELPLLPLTEPLERQKKKQHLLYGMRLSCGMLKELRIFHELSCMPYAFKYFDVPILVKLVYYSIEIWPTADRPMFPQSLCSSKQGKQDILTQTRCIPSMAEGFVSSLHSITHIFVDTRMQGPFWSFSKLLKYQNCQSHHGAPITGWRVTKMMQYNQYPDCLW